MQINCITNKNQKHEHNTSLIPLILSLRAHMEFPLDISIVFLHTHNYIIMMMHILTQKPYVDTIRSAVINFLIGNTMQLFYLNMEIYQVHAVSRTEGT